MQIYSRVHVRVKKHEAFYMYARLVLIRPNVNMAKVLLITHNHLQHRGDSSLNNYKEAKWCWTYLDSHQVDGQLYMNQVFHRSFLLSAVPEG